MKLLPSPNTSTLFFKLYTLRNQEIISAIDGKRISIKKRSLKKSIIKQLNKKGFRVCSFMNGKYATFCILSPIRITHCKVISAEEERLVDTLMSASFFNALNKNNNVKENYVIARDAYSDTSKSFTLC